jgi:hypothetical protein
MTQHDFIIWLDGYLSADQDIPKNVKTVIFDKMKTVNEDYSHFSILSSQVPPLYRNPVDSSKVPYSTLCSCNPANGGSGICGCIQGNKLVEKDYLTRANLTSMNTTELGQLVDLQMKNIKNHEEN